MTAAPCIVLDTGSVDGNGANDYAAAYAAGVRAVYLRKSFKYGARVVADEEYALNAPRARAAGIVVGAYPFLDFSLSAPSPKEQIRAFMQAAGDIIPGTDMPPALDLECGAGFRNIGRGAAELAGFLQVLIRETEDQAGCTPVIYTSYFQADDFRFGTPAWITECPLWVKTAYRLGAKQPMDAVIPMTPHAGPLATDSKNYHRIPDAWTKRGWWLEQYQGDATGVPGHAKQADVGRFNVTRPGDTGGHVAWMQRKLAVLPSPHVGPVDADGHYGADLELAVRDFQARHALVVDGVVGPRTFAALAWT